MKEKMLLWSVALILTGSAIAQVPQNGSEPPQSIQLDAKTKLTLLGVTYGSGNMRAPGFESFGMFNPIYRAEDSTVAWVQVDHEPGQWPSFELLVYDTAKTACVQSEPRSRSHIKDGVEVHGFVLEAFPRWDKQFILRAKEFQKTAADGQWVVSNPHPIPMTTTTSWTAEPLPATKADGDLEVTLTKFLVGAPLPHREGSHSELTNDAANQCVHLNFEFRQNGQPTTNWNPWPVRTSDAAGNRARGLIYDYPTNGVIQIWGRMINGADIPPPEHYGGMDGYYYHPGLWPGESPWKVQLEFRRRSDFSPDEIVTFTNLPVKSGTQQDWEDQWDAWDVGKTNFPFTISPATVNGVHLKLLPPLLVPDKNSPGDQKYVSVIIGADPDFDPHGMNLTVVEVTDDQGRELSHPFGASWAGHYNLDFPNVREIKSLNLKLALHKSRFVEFVVKPATQ